MSLSGKVAIVGSSDKVLEKSIGEKIDSFDNIIRFNRAPVIGFENHVGSRTTHRFCNTHVIKNIDLPGQDRNFIPSLRNQIIFGDSPANPGFFSVFHPSCLYQYLNRKSEFSKLLNSESGKWISEISSVYPGHEPSAGLGVISYCINLGLTPYVFGFDHNSDDTKSSPHYWWNKKGVGKYHNLGFERRVIRGLLERNIILSF